MALKEQLSNDLKDAMRAGDATRRDTLRSLLTAITRAEIPGVEDEDELAARQVLSDDAIVDVLQKQAKQRRDSSDAFRRAGRTELADKEDAELGVIMEYIAAAVPQLTREQIAAEVTSIVAETGASGPSDKAKVMPVAIARLKGKADGRVINEVVTELLAAGG